MCGPVDVRLCVQGGCAWAYRMGGRGHGHTGWMCVGVGMQGGCVSMCDGMNC